MVAYTFDLDNPRTFSKEGKWFKDQMGRYLLFRGAGFGSRSKIAPYLPVYPLGPNILSLKTLQMELAAKQDRLAKLKDLGFNVVRLVLQWKGLAPEKDVVVNQDYLQAVRMIVQALFDLGIYSLIDFHQDIAHEGYGGDGFPDWAIANPGALPAFVLPSSSWSLRYFVTRPVCEWPPARPSLNDQVRNTLNVFWGGCLSDTNAPITKLVQTVCETAAGLKDLPGILGYEPFNEPAQVAPITKDTKQQFEQNCLAPFYSAVIGGIEKADPGSAVFVEPRVDWTYFDVLDLEESYFDLASFITDPEKQMKTYLPKLSGEKIVFSFHYYDGKTALLAGIPPGLLDDMSSKPRLWERIFAVILKAADAIEMIPFMTEYGPDYKGAWLKPRAVGSRAYNTQAAAYMDVSLQQIEKSLVNSTLWTFDLYNTDAHYDNWNDEAASIMQTNGAISVEEIIARPYPLRSSAAPTLLFFDSQSKIAAIRMDGKPTDKAPSVIFVPGCYGGDFEVRYTSGKLEWDVAKRYLYWTPDVSQTSHQIVICRDGQLLENLLPSEALELLRASKQVFPSKSASSTLYAMGSLGSELVGTWTNAALFWSITFGADDSVTESLNDKVASGTYETGPMSTLTIEIGGSRTTYQYEFPDFLSNGRLRLTDSLHGIEIDFSRSRGTPREQSGGSASVPT
jgi:hypothetical protein